MVNYAEETPAKDQKVLVVCDGARFKYKLLGAMFIFNLRKNKHLL
jgi:hypothetical protein